MKLTQPFFRVVGLLAFIILVYKYWADNDFGFIHLLSFLVLVSCFYFLNTIKLDEKSNRSLLLIYRFYGNDFSV